MIVIGLTGSIGMGKSTAAAALRRWRLPVFDADRTVHALMRRGGAAVTPILTAFPGVADGAGGIDRGALGARVFRDPAALRRLEAILHPCVRAAQRRFLAAARRRRARCAILDVPLLLETGGGRRCDAVIVVSAPHFLQRQRVLRRPGMTPERLASVLREQMPDAEKRRRADAVIPTGLGRRLMATRLADALARIGASEGRSRGRPSGRN